MVNKLKQWINNNRRSQGHKADRDGIFPENDANVAITPYIIIEFKVEESLQERYSGNYQKCVNEALPEKIFV